MVHVLWGKYIIGHNVPPTAQVSCYWLCPCQHNCDTYSYNYKYSTLQALWYKNISSDGVIKSMVCKDHALYTFMIHTKITYFRQCKVYVSRWCLRSVATSIFALLQLSFKLYFFVFVSEVWIHVLCLILVLHLPVMNGLEINKEENPSMFFCFAFTVKPGFVTMLERLHQNKGHLTAVSNLYKVVPPPPIKDTLSKQFCPY